MSSVATTPDNAAAVPTDLVTVLFLCYNNAGRSLIAETLFNARAAERKIDAHAESAGLLGVGAVHPMVLRCLEELGVSVDGVKPKQVTPEMVARAEVIVGFGGMNSDHSAIKFTVTEHWTTANPSGESYGSVCAVRDEISRNVDHLLDRLSAQ
ncbi:MAG TPA: low molecular weight phosphatase family protein [Fimbriimonadaceae bacterium]|nr:low molecular weight phosphatase family protein [Fimbriimonadaceae bacterium]